LKSKILLSGLVLILMASLAPALSSCTSKTTTTASSTTTVTSVTTTNANAPVYGGTLTVMTDWGNTDPAGFDADLSPAVWSTSVWDAPFLSWLLGGDIDSYGPRGTNAFAFQSAEYIPPQYLGGNDLVTSWSISMSPIVITLKLRSGVTWSANSTIGMASRPFTSADVVYSLTRGFAAPIVGGTYSFVDSVTAPDATTVNINCNTFNANWAYYIGYGYMPGMITCPESGNSTAGAGGEDWRNQSSDGPFIISNYVSGSSVTYTANPNYWGKSTVNGTSYQLPFVSTLVYPIIADSSALVAALETGKVDWNPSQPLSDSAELKTGNSSLIQDKYLTGNAEALKLNRLDNQYLKNESVRRALMMGTDLNTINGLPWPGSTEPGFPIAQGNPAYTSISQLPASTAQLFTYNATTAKQALTAAGYPNGFSLAITIQSTSTTDPDIAALLVSEWAQLGVTLTINSIDATAKQTLDNSRKFDCIMESFSCNNPIVPLSQVESQAGVVNLDVYLASENFKTQYDKMVLDTDTATLTADEKSLALAILDDAGFIPFGDQVGLNVYQPWIKNYYNETDTGYHNRVAMQAEMWIAAH
jgi:peptide/nickel transport system substrate-binding protein